MQRYARGKLEELHLIDCRPWNKACAARYSVEITGTKTIKRGFPQFQRFLSIRLEIHHTSFENFFDQVEQRRISQVSHASLFRGQLVSDLTQQRHMG